jgi:hypothetical protein
MAAAICWGQQIKRISFISVNLFTLKALFISLGRDQRLNIFCLHS